MRSYFKTWLRNYSNRFVDSKLANLLGPKSYVLAKGFGLLSR